MLHIYYPKAMHNIYVKDQENYYRGKKFLRYVQHLLSHLVRKS